jgi:hypothetical protein
LSNAAAYDDPKDDPGSLYNDPGSHHNDPCSPINGENRGYDHSIGYHNPGAHPANAEREGGQLGQVDSHIRSSRHHDSAIQTHLPRNPRGLGGRFRRDGLRPCVVERESVVELH